MKFLKNYKNYGVTSFRLGVFLLASAPFLAALLFLTSISLSFLNERNKIKKDKIDNLFLIAPVLMILVSLVHFFNFEDFIFLFKQWNPSLEIQDNSIIRSNSSASFIGLSNWVPFFICFFGFQSYLQNEKDRETIIKLFVAGTFPVLISGLGQLAFNWHEPLSLLNGLILWFQKPSGTFSGLFNNQNYAGCWLNIVWPFCIAIVCDKAKNIFNKTSSLIFLVSIFIASFLTFSRNAWGGLFLSIPIVLGPIALYWILISAFLIFAVLILKFSNVLPENLDYLLGIFLPARFDILNNIISQFSESSYPNSAYSRQSIFIFAAKSILQKPFLGWGAATFPIFYGFQNSVYISHAHNLILDTSFNYGLIVVIIIFSNIFFICFTSFKKIFLGGINNMSKNYYQRAWWASFFVLFCSQMVDVQYYDLRISISFWILLSGLKCTISNKYQNKICTIQQI